MRVPTSVILEGIARDAPADALTLAWLVANLRDRSFGIVILLISLVGLIPGLSPVIGVLLFVPAVQLMLGRDEPVLPRRIAARRLSRQRLMALLERLIPVLRWMERAVRPRVVLPLPAARRAVGFVILLLGASLLAPIPFSHVIPLLVVVLLAFALLEEDGLLICLALGAGAASLAITAGAIWGTVEAGLLL